MIAKDPIAELVRLVDALVDSQRNVFCAGNGKTEAEIFGRQAIMEHARKMVDEAERLRKDAERYRWLRNESFGQFVRPIVVSQVRNGGNLRYIGPLISRELDESIDAAIQESQS